MATALESLKRLSFDGGLELLVDGFQFQRPEVHHYVLTHFHSDHTIGLTKHFAGGTIYCTEATGRMVTQLIGVAEEHVCLVPLGQSFSIGAVRVTFLDAGHCPGSAIVVFEEIRNDRLIVHTGDLRASADVREALLQWLAGRTVNELYLDTTYCSARWAFPDQNIACQWLQEISQQELAREPETLFLVGSYQIGKEKAAKAVAEAVGSSVYVDHRRWTTLKLADWASDTISSGAPLWSIDKADCRVWMLPLGGLSHDVLLHHLDSSKGRFKAVVAFRPTGWAFTRAQGRKGLDAIKPWLENEGHTRLFAVPYSEHSSFTELRSFVAALKPNRVVPTVNAETRASKEKTMGPLLGLLDLSQDRERIDHYFSSGSRSQVEEDLDGLVDILAVSSGKHIDALTASSSTKSTSSCGSSLSRAGSSSGSTATSSWNLKTAPSASIDLEDSASSSSGAVVVSEDDIDDKPVEENSVLTTEHVSPESSIDSELRQVSLAQQRRLFRYYETLRLQSQANLDHKNDVKRRSKPMRKGKGKGKGKFDNNRSLRKSKLAGMLGVKVDDEVPQRAGKRKAQKRLPAVGNRSVAKRQRSRPSKSTGQIPVAREASEKRPTRFVPKPSARVRERIERAFAHRLYLLAHQEIKGKTNTDSEQSAPAGDENQGAWLDVLGSTGNVYRVTIGARGNDCQCPDFAKGGGVCKHLLFVTLRVLKLSREDHRVWQTGLTASELRPLLAQLGEQRTVASEVAPDEAVLRGYREAKGGNHVCSVRPLPADCPICFEEILEGANARDFRDRSKVAVTCRSCGHHLHVDCRERWAVSSPKGKTCPLCRSPWDAPANEANDGASQQRMNLSSYSCEHLPSLRELYPETHQWIRHGGQSHDR